MCIRDRDYLGSILFTSLSSYDKLLCEWFPLWNVLWRYNLRVCYANLQYHHNKYSTRYGISLRLHKFREHCKIYSSFQLTRYVRRLHTFKERVSINNRGYRATFNVLVYSNPKCKLMTRRYETSLQHIRIDDPPKSIRRLV